MPDNKTEKVQVLLTPEQKEQLLEMVKKTEFSLSHYLRHLIASHLKEKKE